MSRFFMYGTSLEGIEQLMMAALFLWYKGKALFKLNLKDIKLML